jgi:cytochrome d ubiquinol oxidase subunit I
MEPETLARLKFAVTIAFHFIFVPVSIGIAYHLCFMEWKAWRTQDPVWRGMTAVFRKLLAITFVLGVVTGLTMVFQFGTDWSRYSVFVGDVFGGMLAAEALFAFFLESVFMGIYLFAGHRIGDRLRFFSILMVTLGTTLSAFWILVANSWQQTPDGFRVVVEDGMRKAIMTDFWAAVFTRSTIPRVVHQMCACWATGAIIVAGVGAYWVLRHGGQQPVARRTLKVGLFSSVFFSFIVMFPSGHKSAVQVAHSQLEKFAAIEGVYKTRRGEALIVLGFPRAEPMRVEGGIGIPKMLSWIAYGDPDALVKGLEDYPPDERPPIVPTFLAFHVMVGIGLVCLAASVIGLLMLWRGKLFDSKSFLSRTVLAGLVLLMPLPILANELGWMTAEVGRQPWVVYERPHPHHNTPPVPGRDSRSRIKRLPGLRTDEAFSANVDRNQILISLIAFALVYSVLTALWASLMVKTVRGAEMETSEHAGEGVGGKGAREGRD